MLNGCVLSAPDFAMENIGRRFIMRIRRAMRKKTLRRPIKKPRLKRRRLLEQKRRLVAAGISEEQLAHMNARQIRVALREHGV